MGLFGNEYNLIWIVDKSDPIQFFEILGKYYFKFSIIKNKHFKI